MSVEAFRERTLKHVIMPAMSVYYELWYVDVYSPTWLYINSNHRHQSVDEAKFGSGSWFSRLMRLARVAKF